MMQRATSADSQTSPGRPGSTVLDAPALGDVLHAAGLKRTPQLTTIAMVLNEVQGPLTVLQIASYAVARVPTLQLSTVRRTLAVLVAVGLVEASSGRRARTYRWSRNSPQVNAVASESQLP